MTEIWWKMIEKLNAGLSLHQDGYSPSRSMFSLSLGFSIFIQLG